MDLTLNVTRSLHDEHEQVSAMLGKLQGLLREYGPADCPDPNNPGTRTALANLVAAVEVEMPRHFDFEEQELLPKLAATEDDDLGALLIEEHKVILPLAEELADIAKTVRRKGFDTATWTTFHRLGGEFVERLSAHVEKEELALLPALAAAIEPDEDREIWSRYALST